MIDLINSDKKAFLEQITRSIDNQTNLVFNRFHYFFIGIAFLVTAFATLISPKAFFNSSFHLYIALGVAFIGYFLSFFFTFVNYYNSQQVQAMWVLFNKMGGDFDTFEEFYDTAHEICILNYLGFFGHMYTFIFQPFSNKIQAPYTWFISFCFSFAWWVALLLLVFSFVFPYQMYQYNFLSVFTPLFCIFVPPTLFGVAVCKIGERKKNLNELLQNHPEQHEKLIKYLNETKEDIRYYREKYEKLSEYLDELKEDFKNHPDKYGNLIKYLKKCRYKNILTLPD